MPSFKIENTVVSQSVEQSSYAKSTSIEYITGAKTCNPNIVVALVDSTAPSYTITLPNCDTVGKYKQFYIKNDPYDANNNSVTIEYLNTYGSVDDINFGYYSDYINFISTPLGWDRVSDQRD